MSEIKSRHLLKEHVNSVWRVGRVICLIEAVKIGSNVYLMLKNEPNPGPVLVDAPFEPFSSCQTIFG
jgi:hypothetical protein